MLLNGYLEVHYSPVFFLICLKSAIVKRGFLVIYVYFWPLWVFVAAESLSLVAASRGYSSFELCRLLIAVSPLAVEHRH